MYLVFFLFTEKEQSSDGEGGDDGVSGGEKAGEPESCTDDEKQSRLNHGTVASAMNETH